MAGIIRMSNDQSANTMTICDRICGFLESFKYSFGTISCSPDTEDVDKRLKYLRGRNPELSTDDVRILGRSESRLWIRDINPARFNAEGDGIGDGLFMLQTQLFLRQS